MSWVDILVIIILIFSFIGGLKDGVIKGLVSVAALIIALRLAGSYYYIIASFLAFLPGSDWANFIGFFITLALISLILHLIFFLPRKFIQAIWPKGVLSSLLGGGLNVLNAGIGLVVFTLVLAAYPIIGWLEEIVVGSSVLAWLLAHLGFVLALLPDIFQQASRLV